jgi:hypothetical protein
VQLVGQAPAQLSYEQQKELLPAHLVGTTARGLGAPRKSGCAET